MTQAAQILNPQSEAPLPGASSNTPAPANEPAANAPWYDSVQDPDTKTWLANKKYESPEMLAKAGRSLEQLLGADKAGRAVVLPKDENDTEGWKTFRSKLGVPESADGYKLPLPEGDDGGFAKTAAGWFHEANIPQGSAEKIAAKWNGFITEQIKVAEVAEQQKSEKQLNDLKVEWAHEFDTKSEMARRGFREVGKLSGLDETDLTKIESSLGTAKMLKMFAQIGQYTAEGGFKGGDGGGGFGLNPSKAQDQINAFIADRAAGKINDHQWRTETEPKINELLKVITK